MASSSRPWTPCASEHGASTMPRAVRSRDTSSAHERPAMAAQLVPTHAGHLRVQVPWHHPQACCRAPTCRASTAWRSNTVSRSAAQPIIVGVQRWGTWSHVSTMCRSPKPAEGHMRGEYLGKRRTDDRTRFINIAQKALRPAQLNCTYPARPVSDSRLISAWHLHHP